MLTSASPEDDQVYQRIGAEAIGSVDGDTGDLASGIEARHRCPLRINHDTGIDIGRDAAHGVVCRGLDRYRLGNRFDAEVVAGKVGDIRQFLGNHLGSQVPHIQVNIIFAVYAAPLFDLLNDTARDDIAWGQVFKRGHIAFHEVFVFAVEQLATLTTGRLAEQNAHFIDAGGVELVHLHVLQRNATAIGDSHTITSTGKGVAGDAPGPAIAASGEEHGLGMERVNLAGANLHRHNAASLSLVDQQVKHEKFVEEAHLVFDGTLIHRLQNHVAGAVGGIAGTAHGGFTEIARMSTKATLVNAPVLGAIEREAAMFQFVDGVDGLAGQNFRRRLIDEIVAALDGIVHVPFPMVFFLIAQGGRHATLCRARVRARRIDLAQHGNAGSGQVASRPSGPRHLTPQSPHQIYSTSCILTFSGKLPSRCSFLPLS